MKISALLEGRKRLVEGGNLSINGHEAQHLDLKVTKRSYMVPKLNELLYAINSAYYKMYKESLWSNEVLASGKFLSGSSLHFFNVKGISDEVFTEKKPTVGDIDTMVDKTKEPNLQQFLTAYTNKQIGAAVFLGFQRGNEQFSGLFELQDPPVKVQIDFEFVEFEKDNPTDWARFSHSSSWEDLQAGVKGVFHKWLIQAFTALTRKNFILRKMKGRGKLRQEVDEPATDNMYSFAVSSKEGGGLRAKYEPVLDDNGNPLVIKGLPVMREAPTSGYNQNIGQIFSTILDQRLSPKQAKTLQNQFWSFTGLLQVMNTLLTPEEKEQVMQGFLKKTIDKGAQGMYKNNPDKDIAEKTLAINTLLNTLKLPKPSDLDQLIDAYRKSYKYSEAGTDEKTTADAGVVKAMAKNTLAEAIPSYKRKGIQHIYNPGSSTEMKDADFINFCKEIAHDGGNFASVPINLKVDGAGIRFGKTQNGEPFFMTSRVETPMTKANIGDFEKYGRSQGQSDEQLARTQNYDKALSTIVNAEFMKDIPPDTIVQAEMLFNPMAHQDSGGYKFVNIPYDPKKLGKVMTLVPISVKQYSTGEQSPDAAEIKEALIKDSTPNIKMVNNTLSHKGIDVSKIVNPIVKNSEALLNAVSQRGDSPDKQKAKAILSTARQALSKSIINSPIPGKDQLGDMIEGLVINMPSGTLAKVTSPDMQQKMADKQAMNKKPTEGGNRTKPAVITYGSFVGHKGHEQLIDQTIGIAKQVGGVPFIYVSPVVGPDDPVPPADKVKTLQKLYPQYANNIQVWDSGGTAMKKIEKELVLPANSPYNKIIVVVGADRKDSTESWVNSLEKRMKDPAAIAKYGGTQNQVEFQTVGTERDPSKGGTGISFTQLRDKLKDPNASEQDKLNFWMQAFDSQKLGAEWIKHLMDTTAQYSNNQQAIKEYIQKIKPMLEYTNPTQKVKIYNQLLEAKQQLSEMGEPSSNNLANVVAKLINSKKPEIFSRYGDKKVMDTIIDTCTNNVGKTEMELAVEAMTKLKHFVKEDYDRSMLRDGFSTEQEINGILYKAVGKSFKGSYGGTLTITAYDKNKKIGIAQFTDHFEKSGLESLNTDVDPAYQRQGIASTMYAYARMLGNTIHPSIVQTKQGEKMWKGWKKSGDAKFLKKEGVAEGSLNESAYEEAWELISQPVPEIQQFVKQLGLAQDDTTAKQIAPMIDATPDTQLPAASIPKLKNLANKGNDVQTLKAIQQISGRPDAVQQYAKIMQARDAGEGRQRGYDVNGLINSVKSGNYEAPVLLKLATGTYVIGGRTRLYAALALGIPAKVKIISGSTFAKQGQQGVAEGPQDDPVKTVIKFYEPIVHDIHKEKIDNYVDKARDLLHQTDDPAIRAKLIDIFKKGKENPYIQGGIITTVGALLAGGLLSSASKMGLSPTQTNILLQSVLNTVIPTLVSRINGKSWVDTIKYTLASAGIGTGIAALTEKDDVEMGEGAKGAIAGGIAGAYLTKNPRGAMAGAELGSTLQNKYNDVMSHVAKDLTGTGAPIAKLRAARDKEQMKKRERSDGLPAEPKFDYLDEK